MPMERMETVKEERHEEELLDSPSSTLDEKKDHIDGEGKEKRESRGVRFSDDSSPPPVYFLLKKYSRISRFSLLKTFFF